MAGAPAPLTAPWAGTDAALLALAQAVGGPLLALDASAAEASLALVAPARAGVVERQLPAASLPSESLVAGIESLLADAGLRVAELAALVVGLGPGSFTGLRVGLATIKGLALACDLPVYGVSSLQMLVGAAAAPDGAAAAPSYVLAVRDARREALYAGLYAVYPGGGASPILADAVWTLAALTRAVAAALGDDPVALAGVVVVGDAAPRVALAWRASARQVSPQSRYGLAAAAVALTAGRADDLATLCPRYLRGNPVAPGAGH